MPKAYLTIDDSPTSHTDDLTDFLAARDIPAVLYCIGDTYTDLHVKGQGIAQNPEPLIRAIQKGFIIGNHLSTHRRSSELSYEEVVDEIERTEALIDGLYKCADVTRPAKLLRFPHLDRGCGGWIVDYDRAGVHSDKLKTLFLGGLNVDLKPPSPAQIDMKQKIQDYLKREGFVNSAFEGVTFDWVAETEMADAYDSLCTFSTSDWMLNPSFTEYAKDWPHKTTDDLVRKIKEDKDLHQEKHNSIILMHDHEGLFPVFCTLIESMMADNIQFLQPQV